MNIVLQEWKAVQKSSLLWGLGLGTLGFLFAIMYPGFANDMETFKNLLSSYPKEVLQALGIQLNMIESFEGFYAFGMMYLVFAAAVQGMQLGVKIIAKEYNEKTTEFIFTKPVSRVQILLAKLAATVMTSVISLLIYSLIVILSGIKFLEEIPIEPLLRFSISLLLIEVFFLSFGFFYGVLVGKVKAPLMVSLGTASFFLILQMIGNSVEEQWFKIISVFQYFKPQDLIVDGFDGKYLMLWFGLSAIFIISGLRIFQKKDIFS